MDFLKNLPLVRAGTPVDLPFKEPLAKPTPCAGGDARAPREVRALAGGDARAPREVRALAGRHSAQREDAHRASGADQGSNSSLPLVARLARARCASAACSSG
jgi:hypothetical protein